MKDEELGEFVCQGCGLVVDRALSFVNQQPHGGTPSFNFMYDKALPTVFDARDAGDERVREFQLLSRLDRSVRGIRKGEVTVLNLQRRILPMVERMFSGKPELIKNVKMKVTKMALSQELPRISGVYHAVVCQALLECGVRQGADELLEQLTGSKLKAIGRLELKYDAGVSGWTGTFTLEPDAPIDGYFVKVTAQVPSGGRTIKGSATQGFDVVSEKRGGDDLSDPASRSRVLDDHLVVSLSTDREAYRPGESVCVVARVNFPDGRAVDGEVEGAKVEAVFTSGGKLQAAERALWILRKHQSLILQEKSAPKTVQDFIAKCELLKGERFEAIRRAEEILALFHDFKTPLTSRNASALGVWTVRPDLPPKTVADAFRISSVILQAKHVLYMSLRSQPSCLRV